ncbi:MAG: hypothetical protein AB7G48_05045 [Nitrospiraceae bacterium]
MFELNLTLRYSCEQEPAVDAESHASDAGSAEKTTYRYSCRTSGRRGAKDPD